MGREEKTMTDLDAKLRESVRYAYEHAPAVKARFDQAGVTPDDIQGVADLPKLPILQKDEVVRIQQANPPFGGMLARPVSEVSHIFFSPGPIYEPAPEENESAWDVAMACLRRSGFEAGDVVLNSFSYHLVPAGFLFDRALTRLGCTVVPGGVGNSDLQLKMMLDLQVTGYAGTPSFLMSLIRKAEEQGLDFRKTFKLRKAIVSAEPFPPSLRQQLESYGLTIGNAYGTAEFGLLAINLGDGMAMQLLPEPIVEVVDPETGQPVGAGETGEVVVTNFSRVYPLIRLGTGDMAVNVDPKPGESRQEERAIILVGRSGDAVKVRGMFVHPNQLRFAARQVAGVTAVQGVVTRPDLKDFFTVRAEVEATVDETAVAEQLKQTIRNLCRVRVDKVEFIPAGTLTPDDPGMVDAREWK
ncbi:MAG: phenylacetate--CoA ligase family protein [Chloroflexi bacterium]|nr:MAG: phenylacetate--CoA ligase family protein [Chloroflexota bacterium]